MIERILLLAACLVLAAPALAEEAPKAGPSLATLHQMRMQIGRDQANQDAEARGRTGVRRVAAGGGDRPTLAAMRQENQANLSRIVNRFRCLDVDIDVDGNEGQTNLVLVCGDVVNGAVQNTNTNTGGDLNVSTGATP